MKSEERDAPFQARLKRLRETAGLRSVARGDHARAADMLAEGIELSWQTTDQANLAHFLEALAAFASLRGEAERSTLLLGAAEGSGAGGRGARVQPLPSGPLTPGTRRGREMSFEYAIEGGAAPA